MEGWIKLHRKIKDNKFYPNPNALAIFLELLIRASVTEKTFYWKRQKMHLKPGQCLVGEKELGETFGLSRQTARYWLNELFLDQAIDIKKTTKGSIVTINNWSKYQTIDQNINNKKTTKRQQKDTNKNVKNVKNIYMSECKKILEMFNQIWGTSYTSVRGIENNWKVHRENHTLTEVEKAIRNARGHRFYKDKLTPEMLLRQKNQRGEDVDRIDELLNTRAITQEIPTLN